MPLQSDVIWCDVDFNIDRKNRNGPTHPRKHGSDCPFRCLKEVLLYFDDYNIMFYFLENKNL